MAHRGKSRPRASMAKSALKAASLEDAIARKMATDEGVISRALNALNDVKAGRTVAASDVRRVVRERRDKARAEARGRAPKRQYA